MTGILFTSKSLTYAQHMVRTLLLAGISVKVVRPDIAFTGRSCAYAVNIPASFFPEAVDVLRNNRLYPVRILVSDDGKEFREIRI